MGKMLFSFVGSSGSGKTTFVEKLIKRLAERGYKVGAIKHDAHRFEIDKPGKDSYRFKEAGAKVVVISSSEKLAMVRVNSDNELDIHEIVLRYFGDVDIVITEGYKKSDIPKFEVYRIENGNEPVMFDSPHLLGIITNAPEEQISKKLTQAGNSSFIKSGRKIFAIDDVEGVAGYIENKYLSENITIKVSGIEQKHADMIATLLKGVKYLDFKEINISVLKN
jgi:molybdopterin-guanine dinucleotide biosynthesis protein MobB